MRKPLLAALVTCAALLPVPAHAAVGGAGAGGGGGPRQLYVTAHFESGHSTIGAVTAYTCTATAVDSQLAQSTEVTCNLYLNGGLAATTSNASSGPTTAASAAVGATAAAVVVCADAWAHWSDNVDVLASACTTVYI